MPQPSIFWDRIAARYSRLPVADEAAYQQKLQTTRAFFRPDMEVLEFGCGTGSTAIAHAPYVKHILAIDFSAKMLDIAQGKAEANDIKNVTFQRSSIDAFSAPEQTFDAVLGLSVLHLLEDKEAVIAKVHKMLKPGGVFVSSTACITGIQKLLKVVLPIGRLIGWMPVLKFFTVQDLAASLSNAGFQIDHQWQPGEDRAVFIVAKKVE